MTERPKGRKETSEAPASERVGSRTEVQPVERSKQEIKQVIREDEARIEQMKAAVSKHPEECATAALSLSPEKIRSEYAGQYVPSHVREASPSLMRRVIGKSLGALLWVREHLAGWRVSGREHIPAEGEFLAICNHQGGESGILMGLFAQQSMHLVSGEQTHWQRNPLRTWFLKKLGMLPVKESLAHLAPAEQQTLVERAHPRARAGYQKVVDREQTASPLERTVDLRQSVRSIVACLVRGEPVTLFPEGLFLYDGNSGMRRGYALTDAVALEYERVTGEPLRILPVAIDRKKVQVGQTFTLKEQPKGMGVSRSDAVIAHVAELLPKERQGYYEPIVEKLAAKKAK